MKKVVPSATVTLNSMAQERKQRGEAVFNFAAGDPVLKTHPCICEGASRQMKQGYFPYPPVRGLVELRQAAAAWMQKAYGAPYTAANSVVTCGGKFALFAALQLLVNPGDEVVIVSPFWPSYPEMVKLFGGVPRIVETTEEAGWKLSSSSLRKSLTERSKILILNNGCNPTGILYTQGELQEILDVAKSAGLFVLADEVYSECVYEGGRFFSCAALSKDLDRLLVVQSCSKNFGMTGWRVGFAFGAGELVEGITALQGQSTTGTSILSQWGAISALEHRETVVDYVKGAMRTRRDLFVETFNRLFGCAFKKPASALYAFVPLSLLGVKGSADQVALELARKAGVICVPGGAFGKEWYLRFAYSEEEESIVRGLQALYEALR